MTMSGAFQSMMTSKLQFLFTCAISFLKLVLRNSLQLHRDPTFFLVYRVTSE